MCFGENCAPQAARYVNSQLIALHENAVECLRTHEQVHRTDDHLRYSHALADFVYGRARAKVANSSDYDSMFHASFDAPQVEFLCNHDVVMRIMIKEGHYCQDYTKPAGNVLEQGRVRPINNCEFFFRMGFDTREISRTDAGVSSSKSLIRLIILDLPGSSLQLMSDEHASDKDALVFYLSQYLRFLQDAGYHTLFSLPEFHNSGSRLTIDYSAFGDTTVEVEEIYGISVEKINSQLTSAWLKAAIQADDSSGQPVIESLTYLVEYRCHTSIEGFPHAQFHIKFGPPRIKAVCRREVFMFFPIKEIVITSEDSDTLDEHKYDWEIAVSVDVLKEETSIVDMVRLKVDVGTIRLREESCTLPTPAADDDDDDPVHDYIEGLLDIFITDYISALDSAGQLVIYDSQQIAFSASSTSTDSRDYEEFWVATSDSSTSATLTNTIASWKQMVTTSDMRDFDQIVAVSQTSLNFAFRESWTAASSKSSSHFSLLANWSYSDSFSVAFKPMTVRLLSNERAILCLHLERGSLKPLKNGLPSEEGENHEFQDWQLAFEVDIKISSREGTDEINNIWRTKFADSPAFRQNNNREEWAFRHIYLDLSNLTFVQEYSQFDDLFVSQGRSPVDNVRAMLYYIRTHYLPALTQQGCNILYTIPIWIAKSEPPPHALTNVTFHAYSEKTVNRQGCAVVGPNGEPIIVILGMKNFRTLSALRLRFSTNWVVQTNKGLAFGTVSVSRQALMERVLLDGLARINAITTVIPEWSHVDKNGFWKFQLTTWARHHETKDQECTWTVEPPKGDGSFRFRWEHHVGLTYAQNGSNVVNGGYSVSCTTLNVVEFPPAARSKSMEIRLSGQVLLKVEFRSGAQQGSAQSVAKWSMALTLRTEPNGLKANAAGSTSPVFESTEPSGDVGTLQVADLQTSLKGELQDAINLDDILKQLQQFEGALKSCYPCSGAYCLAYPAFNAHGDLMFELKPQTQLNTPARQVNGGRGRAQRRGQLNGLGFADQSKARTRDSSIDSSAGLVKGKGLQSSRASSVRSSHHSEHGNGHVPPFTSEE
ncbi:uncharacterized protein LAESUDRAFT_206407 [Laetiporus sulphureus 93-53]|uniref:Uncharacterized protein n=1 Tax=Laetiporus sulphureus 93-53 TaxID=1314785 RepID=A0A165DZB0_9APHY|nr:uncharacterized protein LAESUDRAFT_206407 [Laetiporus sulphureus 93-53]KZT05942.1 hypothetical protein LAESUDRAFT_206407 [Laetiporus sulphureus 93-53]